MRGTEKEKEKEKEKGKERKRPRKRIGNRFKTSLMQTTLRHKGLSPGARPGREKAGSSPPPGCRAP